MATKISMKTTDRKDWETPQRIYDMLDAEFHFTIDLAATAENTKCKRFYSPKDDSLLQDWNCEIGFCNPPYGRELNQWVQKAANIFTGTIVMLLPARTDTNWFHTWIYNSRLFKLRDSCSEIRFLKGRLKFELPEDEPCYPRYGAVFPSMIVVFGGISTKP